MLNGLGKSVRDWNKEGFNFVVFKMNITWHKPGLLDDALRVVTTKVPGKSPFRFVLDQKLYRGDELLTEAEVHIVCLDRDMKLQRIPEALRRSADPAGSRGTVIPR